MVFESTLSGRRYSLAKEQHKDFWTDFSAAQNRSGLGRI